MPQAETIIFNNVEKTLSGAICAGYGAIHAEATQEQVETFVEEVEHYLKAVAEDAPGCCIDGRSCANCLDGSKTQVRPSVAGGPLVTAYVAARMTGWLPKDVSVEEGLGIVADYLNANGILTGGHVDQAAVANNFVDSKSGLPKTGCGALDQAPAIGERTHENREEILPISSMLLGEDQSVLRSYVSKEDLRSGLSGWNPTHALNILTADNKKDMVEVLRSDATPTHGHIESLVVFNEIEGTSLDRDALVSERNIQAFCVDMWYLKKIAKAMATGPNAVEQQEQLTRAMTDYQVATYLQLCDGSQRTLHVTGQSSLVA